MKLMDFVTKLQEIISGPRNESNYRCGTGEVVSGTGVLPVTITKMTYLTTNRLDCYLRPCELLPSSWIACCLPVGSDRPYSRGGPTSCSQAHAIRELFTSFTLHISSSVGSYFHIQTLTMVVGLSLKSYLHILFVRLCIEEIRWL